MPSSNAWTDSPLESRPADILLRAADESRFPQSVILTCRDGTALEAVADVVAERLLRPATGDVSQHPDLFALRPAKKMRQISAQNTRELIRKVQHSPRLGDRKVAVIHEAERMHTAAANIFLKTLEEPPADTTILLLTTRPYGLLPTIRSRCLTFRFPDVADETPLESMREWMAVYRAWLERIAEGVRRPPEVSAATITVFGLLTRFQQALETEIARTAEAAGNSRTDRLDDDERSAFEESLKVAVRQRFFLEIEKATHAFARELARKRGAFPVRALRTAVDRLEHSAALLRLNLKEQAALEHFLLQSLRIWARA